MRTTYPGRGGAAYQRWQDRQLGIRRPPRGIPLGRCELCGRQLDTAIGRHCDACADELRGAPESAAPSSAAPMPR